jgi:hypothetical protein
MWKSSDKDKTWELPLSGDVFFRLLLIEEIFILTDRHHIDSRSTKRETSVVSFWIQPARLDRWGSVTTIAPIENPCNVLQWHRRLHNMSTWGGDLKCISGKEASPRKCPNVTKQSPWILQGKLIKLSLCLTKHHDVTVYGGMNPRYPLDRWLGGPQRYKFLAPAGNLSPTSRSSSPKSSHYTDWAIPAL